MKIYSFPGQNEILNAFINRVRSVDSNTEMARSDSEADIIAVDAIHHLDRVLELQGDSKVIAAVGVRPEAQYPSNVRFITPSAKESDTLQIHRLLQFTQQFYGQGRPQAA